jgi:ABC-type sugar transport system substrate-binding protein
MEPGKVVIFTYKESENNLQKYLGQKMAMDYFKIEVHEVAQRGSGGDPTEQAYEDMKNLLLADSKKEIKGVLDYWEGKAYGSARACHEMGRDDVMVVTIDDSPRTYELMRQLPALRATFGVNGHRNMVAEKMCSMFEEIFAGKPFHDQNYFPLVPYLVEKENLPPQGFIYRPGPAPYEGKPDYKAE